MMETGAFGVSGEQHGRKHPGKLRLLITLTIVFAATLTIYLVCAAPGVLYGDSAELQAVALDGGVAHPTGYPTFVLLGRVFGSILGGEPAHRITVMSAVFGAASICAFITVLLKLGLPMWGAVSGALVYAMSFTFFWSSIRTEVYTVAIFMFFIGLWLSLHALEHPGPKRVAGAGLFLGLVLTGHLAFAPAVMVILIALVVARPAEGGSRTKYISVLAVTFISGLLPYLYLFWADRAGYPMNYLQYTIEPAGNQYGLTAERFDDLWERIPWLIFGKESQPVIFLVHPRPMVWQVLRVLSIEFIYHFGPVAIPLFLLGIYQALRKLMRRSWLIFGIIIASAVFGAGFGPGRMLQIFIIPSTIGVAMTVSFGIWYLVERLAGDPAVSDGPGGRRLTCRAYVLLAAVTCSIIFLPHSLRIFLEDSRTFPGDFKMQVEGEPEIDTFVPRLDDFREPRQYGERVLRQIPEGSLVVGKWKEIMTLYYLHYIEGERPDISLEPYDVAHYIRLNRWQDKHDIVSRPIVFLRHPSELQVDVTEVDTFVVNGDEAIYILDRPFEPLPAPANTR
jgi:hypothetical protein